MYKLEVYVIDYDGCGLDECILAVKYGANGVVVKNVATTDIGEWTDSHILNSTNTPVEKFREYFNEE